MHFKCDIWSLHFKYLIANIVGVAAKSVRVKSRQRSNTFFWNMLVLEHFLSVGVSSLFGEHRRVRQRHNRKLPIIVPAFTANSLPIHVTGIKAHDAKCLN